jgi:O-acetyl-ADP-ribose deacetylase (regulator of RNase III)
MGSVFKTSNGGAHKGGVVPKIIYHAVVAAQSRLVSEAAISKATIKSLTQADEDGCKVVAMMPMDCGNFDLHQTANAQLNAIYKFLQTVSTKNIRHIFIVTTKNDKVTLDIFNEKFDRIFGEE